jgi:lysophospholipase L1-like esterase
VIAHLEDVQDARGLRQSGKLYSPFRRLPDAGNSGTLSPVIARTRRRLLVAVIASAGLVLAAGCGDSPTAPSPPPTTLPPPAPPPPPPPPPPPAPILGVTRILAFGDSLTEGESSGTFLPRLPWTTHDPSTPGVPTSYPAKLQGLMDDRYTDQVISIFNGGKGGERASEGFFRMLELIDQLRPEAMILMTGVNDLNGGVSVSTTADAVEDLVKAARGQGVAVFLSTLPRQIEGRKRADSFDEVLPYNEVMAAIALDEGATLVDIYPHITEDLLLPDGLHITEAGNEVLAGVYFEALKAAYEAPPGAFGRR